MFANIKTFNPLVGCTYNCVYCWARKLAETRLKHLPQYRNGFTPHVVGKELNRRFNGGNIFVSSMGDLFGDVSAPLILEVLRVIRESPKATFYLLTKNPYRYKDFRFPDNVILGATIESNLNHKLISDAPDNFSRIMEMIDIQKRKFISIEPIMDFEIWDFTYFIRSIKPEFVYIGYDNWNNHLPEPPLAKTQELIKQLREFTEVREKTIRKAWNE